MNEAVKAIFEMHTKGPIMDRTSVFELRENSGQSFQ